MEGKEHVGRAPIPRRDVPRQRGRAKVGRAVGKAPPPERAATQIVEGLDASLTQPVFVDHSGTRRRHLRRLTYLLGLLLLVVLVLVVVSQLVGGPSRPPSQTTCTAVATHPANRTGCPK